MADFKREVLSDYKDGVTDLSRLRSQKDIALYNHAGAQHAQRKLIKDTDLANKQTKSELKMVSAMLI